MMPSNPCLKESRAAIAIWNMPWLWNLVSSAAKSCNDINAVPASIESPTYDSLNESRALLAPNEVIRNSSIESPTCLIVPARAKADTPTPLKAARASLPKALADSNVAFIAFWLARSEVVYRLVLLSMWIKDRETLSNPAPSFLS
ncbi:MAG: hypothetical protein ACXAC5_00195 [Promethearchaeota archaeon]